LIRDAEGNLYGTTSRGGISYWGMAFKLDPRGKESVLYNFLGGYGELPASGLIRDAKGVSTARRRKEVSTTAERRSSWICEATRPCCIASLARALPEV